MNAFLSEIKLTNKQLKILQDVSSKRIVFDEILKKHDLIEVEELKYLKLIDVRYFDHSPEGVHHKPTQYAKITGDGVEHLNKKEKLKKKREMFFE